MAGWNFEVAPMTKSLANGASEEFTATINTQNTSAVGNYIPSVLVKDTTKVSLQKFASVSIDLVSGIECEEVKPEITITGRGTTFLPRLE